MNVLTAGLFSTVACGLALSAFGQNSVSAIDVFTPNRALQVEASDACSVDFRNIRVYGENRDWTAQLKDGKFERKVDSGYEAVTLDQVFCFAPKSRGERHAIIVLNWLDCGGSCSSTGVVQLIAIRSGHPVIIQQFVFDSHAAGTGVKFNEKSLILTVTGRSDDGSPNCCAKNFEVVTYRWGRSKFVQKEYKRVAAPTPEGDR